MELKMEVQTQNKSTAGLLDKMYKNVKMGSDSIINLMPKVTDEKMRQEFTAQLDKYNYFAKKIGTMLNDEGEKPKEENIMTRLSAKVGVGMNTMLDSTPSHLAQMMMEGYTMGITEMTRDIRDFENTKTSEASLKLAREIVSFEEESYEKMKNFL